ncbi:DUF2508 family protein, partial [Bacillus sp. D-CC]
HGELELVENGKLTEKAKKKGKLRKEYDDKLIVLLEKVKNEWLRQKRMVEQSVEPSQDVLCSLKIAEAKYCFF